MGEFAYFKDDAAKQHYYEQFDRVGSGLEVTEPQMVTVAVVPAGEPALAPFGMQPLNTIPLPLEPLFELPVAALMIPMKYASLKTFLNVNKAHFLARYRKDNSHRRHRLLSSSEIRYIRTRIISGPGKAHMQPII